VQIDDSDPLTFLDLPIGRAVFLVGDSGRVEETSTSIPPEQGHKRFIAREIAVRRANGASDEIVGVSAPDERSSPLGAKQRSSAIEFSIAESARKNDSVGGRHTLNLGDGAPGQRHAEVYLARGGVVAESAHWLGRDAAKQLDN
jgi:hypothetical protein